MIMNIPALSIVYKEELLKQNDYYKQIFLLINKNHFYSFSHRRIKSMFQSFN